MNLNRLGARSIHRFLAEYWQQKPLLARNILPQLSGLADRTSLIELACRDDVESRLVFGAGKSWRVKHGPFRRRDFARLPSRNWTLLVNGVENLMPAAREIQQLFGFIPYARQDDVMISHAAPGGSVGPHFDSYDVFLVQGAGARRWQVSAQHDLELIDGAPLKILRRFRPQREWTLQPGDLLYLPPRYAHHGIAAGDCITWSIGCRAPVRQEMAARFLDYLQDRLQLDGGYRDSGLKLQRHPAVISAGLLRHVRATVRAIRWNDADIVRCLGEYLSEPRPNVVFSRPRRLPPARFAHQAAERGLRLNLKTRMLLHGRTVFVNGEALTVDARGCALLQRLADRRELTPPVAINQATLAPLYRWHCAGYIEIGEQ